MTNIDTTDLSDARRLEILRDELAEIAVGIRCAQWAFLDSSDIVNTAFLVSCTLGRLGWMTDRACVIAGDDVPPVVGDAEAWMRNPSDEDRDRLFDRKSAEGHQRTVHHA